jgi:hypothetical protein
MDEFAAIDELRRTLKSHSWPVRFWILQTIAILSAGSIGWALRSVIFR